MTATCEGAGRASSKSCALRSTTRAISPAVRLRSVSAIPFGRIHPRIPPKTHKKYVGARVQPVLDAMKLMKRLGMWLELTTLLIRGINDDDGELKDSVFRSR